MRRTARILVFCSVATGSITSSSGCNWLDSHRPRYTVTGTHPRVLESALRALELIERYRLEEASSIVAKLSSQSPNDLAARGISDLLERHLARSAERLIVAAPGSPAFLYGYPPRGPTAAAAARSAELKRAGLRLYAEGHVHNALKLWRVALELNSGDAELRQFISRAEKVAEQNGTAVQ